MSGSCLEPQLCPSGGKWYEFSVQVLRGPVQVGAVKWAPEQRFHREVALIQFLLQGPGALVKGDSAGLRLKRSYDHNLDVERELK